MQNQSSTHKERTSTLLTPPAYSWNVRELAERRFKFDLPPTFTYIAINDADEGRAGSAVGPARNALPTHLL